ncbi:MAG: guanylate kinase [Verrucomicrobia bacterium]|jgi:guanylate kinase|nr:guanylate kinase [Verrucomicrobiota bacterium]
MKKPLLIVVSAPSGAGKSTLCDRLLAEHEDITYSVSCTTRCPRGEEVDGGAYYFLTSETFEVRAARGEFLEHATVHGNRYGTLKETVRSAMTAGKSVMMDIDVQGARQVRDALAGLSPDDAMVRGFVDIFIQPPSMLVLRERLEGRGEDAADVIERRLENAAQEMACAEDYRYTVVNDDLAMAQSEIREILNREVTQ